MESVGVGLLMAETWAGAYHSLHHRANVQRLFAFSGPTWSSIPAQRNSRTFGEDGCKIHMGCHL